MAEDPTSTLVGCLLDVSGSMKNTLESGRTDERAIDRLRAVLDAALKLAQAENRSDPQAFIFIGAFGLHGRDGCPPIIDLGSVIDALSSATEGRTGREALIEIANENNVGHVSRYIRTKLSDEEAAIVSVYLRKHPGAIDEFVRAIPSGLVVESFQRGMDILSLTPLNAATQMIEKRSVDNSESLIFARHICKNWLQDFVDIVPHPVSRMESLLKRLQDRPVIEGDREELLANNLLETLRKYIYGATPMKGCLQRTKSTFDRYPDAKRRILVLISDGDTTDGDPMPLAQQMRHDNITIATIFLTNDHGAPRRQLYDRNVGISTSEPWHQRDGRKVLISMASTVASNLHPIPVLLSTGWRAPSSGECALSTTVCSSLVLEEFCEMLLSARFGSADVLLDLVGKVQLDKIINNEHMITRSRPSDQGQSGTCFAHAAAAVIHMAIIRIEGREGGYPSVAQIRNIILQEFPPGRAYSSYEIIKEATSWYGLRFREVGENGARQAVIHRRPVLTLFHLSDAGWHKFETHFGNSATRTSVLTRADMDAHRSPPHDSVGHSVVLTGCAPESLTFLNSWGSNWGDGGSFSVEDSSVLHVSNVTADNCVRYYDIFWYESDLTPTERQAFMEITSKDIMSRAEQHPGLFELPYQCPRCSACSPIAQYRGTIRRATCPQCREEFTPEPGDMVKALYIKAGLRNLA